MIRLVKPIDRMTDISLTYSYKLPDMEDESEKKQINMVIEMMTLKINSSVVSAFCALSSTSMYDQMVKRSLSPSAWSLFCITSFRCFKWTLFSWSFSLISSFVIGISLIRILAYFANSGSEAIDDCFIILLPMSPAIVKPGQYSICQSGLHM